MLSETEYADGPLSSGSGDRVEPSAPGVQCSVCSSTFRRPEHLKRHLRSHTKEKPFECPQCGRHFSRTDTLHRHELSHHTQGSEGGKDRTHRITVKTFRACFGCAMARVRCSGGIPCGRCDVRSLECQYPTQRRSKTKARNETSRRKSVADDHESQKSHTSISSSQTRRNRSDLSQTEGMVSFRLEQLDDTQQAPVSLAPNSAATPPQPMNSDGRAPTSGVPNTDLYMSNSNKPSATSHVPPEIYQREGDSRPGELVNHDPPKVYNTQPGAIINSELRQIQPVLSESGTGMDIDMPENPDIALEFDPSLFDQSMISTINWLPNEFFAPGDQIQPAAVSSQYPQPVNSGSYPTRVGWEPPAVNTRQISPSLPVDVGQAPHGNISLPADISSPRRHSHVASEASPAAGSVDSANRSAHYYVDGGGARLTRYRSKQTPRSTSSVGVAHSIKSPFDGAPLTFGFPIAQETHLEDVSQDILRSLKPIETSKYDEIYGNFILLCRQENPFFDMFDSAHFPAADECNRYIVCFFDSFQSVYPIIHLPTFDPNQCHWLLTLAIVAIGCHSSGTLEADQSAAAFHEMIRRAFLSKNNKETPRQYYLDLIQARLLNFIGLLHSEYECDKRSALNSFTDIVALSNHEGLLASRPKETRDLGSASSEAQWAQWIQHETRKRTGYCIWLLDSTLAYYFDQRPLYALDDGQADLPANEKQWQANSAESWKQQWDSSTDNESLYDAVHILYIEKRLVTDTGDLSHILLIHALYQRMWEVGDYFRRPLSFWDPTAKKESCESAIPAGSVWLPGIPSYSKWRNSACDCLDIMHWTANSTIAKAAGLEHPTVLHLHAARLVLLAPFREIRSLVTSLASDQVRWSQRHQGLEWQYIWRWVKHDQYKARLSIIHAGVTLWHIRRYSTNAFHEPVAAFLAVLTLWAYGSCHANERNSPSPHSETTRTESSQGPNFVHLDRPCDDELVQLFVREGFAMRGNVTGVGDICAPEGPERILRVGCEILSGLTAWGISKRLIGILTRLTDIMAQNRDSD